MIDDLENMLGCYSMALRFYFMLSMANFATLSSSLGRIRLIELG